MKKVKLIVVVIPVVLILGCAGGRPQPETVIEDSCIPPPNDVSISGGGADVNASAYKIGEIFDLDLSTEQKTERIRAEIEGINSIEAWEYRMCVAHENERISDDEYATAIKEMTELLRSKGLPEKKSG